MDTTFCLRFKDGENEEESQLQMAEFLYSKNEVLISKSKMIQINFIFELGGNRDEFRSLSLSLFFSVYELSCFS